MKITIEAEPKDAAKFLTEFIKISHEMCANGEKAVADMFLQMLQKSDKKSISSEEVPAGGYFQ